MDNDEFLFTIRKKDIIALKALHNITSDEIIKSLTVHLKVELELFLNNLSDETIEKHRREITEELKNG